MANNERSVQQIKAEKALAEANIRLEKAKKRNLAEQNSLIRNKMQQALQELGGGNEAVTEPPADGTQVDGRASGETTGVVSTPVGETPAVGRTVELIRAQTELAETEIKLEQAKRAKLAEKNSLMKFKTTLVELDRLVSSAMAGLTQEQASSRPNFDGLGA